LDVPLRDERAPTGEEGETQVFLARGKLFALDKVENKWRERGVGGVKLNQSKEGSTRLVMRMEATLRLLLNVALWPSMVVQKAGEKGVKFLAKEKEELISYLVQFGKPDIAQDFINAVDTHKKIFPCPK